jgi:membrane carboxypeptidase/penicillin-binding protein
LLGGLAKGPAYFNPDRFPMRVRERHAYVLKRMLEDNVITPDQYKQASAAQLHYAFYERPRREMGFYFIDHVIREARTLVGMQSLTVDSYTVHSTINQKLQQATEAALQEGLARYERSTERARFEKPELNISDLVQRIDNEQRTRAQRRGQIVKTVWQLALEAAKLPLYDVHWTPAVVLDKRGGIRVGIADGRTMLLTFQNEIDRGKLALFDVIYVKVSEGKKPADARAELRIRPHVQGAAVVLENKTGRILAMAGGFSYVASQLNRTTQSLRQPGSSIKPLIYLTALHNGLQPTTQIPDTSITLPPISGSANARWEYWTPKNYGGGSGGSMTLRRAIERSRNIATAHLLDGFIDPNPKNSLDKICDLALQAHIYAECMRKYPFVLGAQALRMIDLAGFYAAIPSEGAYNRPHAIDSIELRGKTIYKAASTPTWLAGGDRVAFYQLRTLLEGVVTRGTAAAAMRDLSGYVGGKTGTTDSENDSWFVSFTNDVTVAVWVGYDNASARRTLGHSGSGGHLAAPIARPIIEASWQLQAPRTLLPPPSAEAMKRMRTVTVGPDAGIKLSNSGHDTYVEYLRFEGRNKTTETPRGQQAGTGEDTQPRRKIRRPADRDSRIYDVQSVTR